MQGTADAVKAKVREAQSNCQDQQRAVEHTRRNLQQQQQQTGTYAVAAQFDHQAPAVLDAITRNAKMFDRPPIGPLGALLTITDEGYASATNGWPLASSRTFAFEACLPAI